MPINTLIKTTLASIICILFLSSCSSIGNKAGDFIIRTLLENYVGDNYTVVASRTRAADVVGVIDILSPPQVKLIGDELYNKKLASGNSIYVHLLPQQKQETGGFSLGASPYLSNTIDYAQTTEQRFDVLAFLVDKNGTIIDYGHGRYNTQSRCTSIIFIGKLSGCDEKRINSVSSEVKSLIMTSSNKPLSSWK